MFTDRTTIRRWLVGLALACALSLTLLAGPALAASGSARVVGAPTRAALAAHGLTLRVRLSRPTPSVRLYLYATSPRRRLLASRGFRISGTAVTVRWRLPAAVLRRVRPGRYSVVVRGGGLTLRAALRVSRGVRPSAAPANSSPPTISGTPQSGEILYAQPGSWTGAQPMVFDYQWRRCDDSGSNCAAMSGASGAAYALTDSDVGHVLRVSVTATNTAGSAVALSDPVTVAGDSVASAPASTSPPAISGIAQAGRVLSASAGGWSGSQPISFAYRWARCDSGGAKCSPVTANGASYGVTAQDVGGTLRVTVTATNSVGSASATSPPSAVVQAASTGGGAGVVALWHMDETSGSVMHDAVGGHDGSLSNVSTGQAGTSGHAYGFDGSSSYASAQSAPDLSPGSANITITIALNSTGTPPADPNDWDLIRKGDYQTSPTEWKIEVVQNNGQLLCGFKGTATYAELIAGPPLNDGSWHVVQCVKTPSTIQAVVDGQVVGTKNVTIGSLNDTGDPVTIGAHPGTDFYQGLLDEASIAIG